jgi:hypothetical protein
MVRPSVLPRLHPCRLFRLNAARHISAKRCTTLLAETRSNADSPIMDSPHLGTRLLRTRPSWTCQTSVASNLVRRAECNPPSRRLRSTASSAILRCVKYNIVDFFGLKFDGPRHASIYIDYVCVDVATSLSSSTTFASTTTMPTTSMSTKIVHILVKRCIR